MSQAILNSGFMDMLLGMHIYDSPLFYSSTAERRICVKSLQAACHATLDMICRAIDDPSVVHSHPLNVFWPRVIGVVCADPIKLMGQRHSLWRAFEADLIHRRLCSLDDYSKDSFCERFDYIDISVDLVEFAKYVIHVACQ